MVSCNIYTETKKKQKTLYYKKIPVLQCSISLPVFSSRCGQAALARINRFYTQTERYLDLRCEYLYKMAVRQYYESNRGGFPFRRFEMQTVFAVTYNENCALSVYMDRYEYTGGAHGMTVRTSQTFNTRSGTLIPLSAYFPPGVDYEKTLEDEVIRHIARMTAAGRGGYFENYPELVRKYFKPENYYLVPGGIAVYFQLYEIAPYAFGIPVFQIPFRAVGAQPPRCKRV